MQNCAVPILILDDVPSRRFLTAQRLVQAMQSRLTGKTDPSPAAIRANQIITLACESGGSDSALSDELRRVRRRALQCLGLQPPPSVFAVCCDSFVAATSLLRACEQNDLLAPKIVVSDLYLGSDGATVKEKFCCLLNHMLPPFLRMVAEHRRIFADGRPVLVYSKYVYYRGFDPEGDWKRKDATVSMDFAKAAFLKSVLGRTSDFFDREARDKILASTSPKGLIGEILCQPPFSCEVFAKVPDEIDALQQRALGYLQANREAKGIGAR